MTITTPISAQSIGTSTNVGNSKFPQKITLESTTTAVQIEGRIVNGAGYYDKREGVTIHYAFSAISVTAAAAVAMLGQSSRFLALDFAAERLVDQAKMSLLEPAPGTGFLYLWCDVPNTDVAAALSVNVIQYP
jgi:hypothetical protein